MATLYAIVWVAIIFAFIVYCMAGRTVWRKRKELPGFLNPLNEDPFKNMVSTYTEIEIVSRPRRPSSPFSPLPDNALRGVPTPSSDDDYGPYTIKVEAGKQASSPRRPSMPGNLTRLRSLTRTAALNEMNAEAWLYARTSFLFFLALLITWVRFPFPSLSNRNPQSSTVKPKQPPPDKRRSPQASTASTPSRTLPPSISRSTTPPRSSSPCKASGTQASISSPRRPPAAACGAISASANVGTMILPLVVWRVLVWGWGRMGMR